MRYFFLLLLILSFASCTNEESELAPVDRGNETVSDSDSKETTDTKTDDEEIVPDQPAVDESSSDETSDTTTVADEDPHTPVPDEDFEEPHFNADDPGFSLSFAIYLFNTGKEDGVGMGLIHKAGLEDFPEGQNLVPPESCMFFPSAGECAVDSDCHPTQECFIPEDEDGDPDEAKAECVTPRDSLNRGTVKISGFVNGAHNFSFDEDSDGYLSDKKISSDGKINVADIAFNTTYTLEAIGEGADGPGNFSGSVTVPGKFVITHPETSPGQIKYAKNSPFVLKWDGASHSGNVFVRLRDFSRNALVCNANDDGEITVPVSELSKLGIVMNTPVEIIRIIRTDVRGDNLSIGEFLFVEYMQWINF